MSNFDIFIGIDYSGAKTATSRLRGLQVFALRPANASPEHWRSPTRSSNGGRVNWTRKEVYERLLEETRAGRRFLAGIDHCFSFPESFFKRYDIARTWPDFLDDFVRHWPTHEDNASVERVRDGSMHRNHAAPPRGQRTGDTNEFRICERWTSSAKSVFQFDVQGSVAKSSHAGIPWLKKLRDEVGNSLHFWPFDGWEPDSGKSVIVEIYPSIFRNRYNRDARTTDEQDAYATARWMADMAAMGVLDEYFSPPLSYEQRVISEHEGWILGIR